MNDRFKFRWYSKIYNEMCDVNCIEPNNEFVNFQQGKFNDISTRINLGNGVLMQCTGLKDKNGKLIYEGDIVKFNFDTDEIIAVVSWDDNEGQVGYYLNTTDYFKDKYVTDYDFYKNDYEVLGNIYENPELLESEG